MSETPVAQKYAYNSRENIMECQHANMEGKCGPRPKFLSHTQLSEMEPPIPQIEPITSAGNGLVLFRN
jgi:hypothetical protein